MVFVVTRSASPHSVPRGSVLGGFAALSCDRLTTSSNRRWWRGSQAPLHTSPMGCHVLTLLLAWRNGVTVGVGYQALRHCSSRSVAGSSS